MSVINIAALAVVQYQAGYFLSGSSQHQRDVRIQFFTTSVVSPCTNKCPLQVTVCFPIFCISHTFWIPKYFVSVPTPDFKLNAILYRAFMELVWKSETATFYLWKRGVRDRKPAFFFFLNPGKGFLGIADDLLPRLTFQFFFFSFPCFKLISLLLMFSAPVFYACIVWPYLHCNMVTLKAHIIFFCNNSNERNKAVEIRTHH